MVSDPKKSAGYVKKWAEKNQAEYGFFYMIMNYVTGDRFVGYTIQPFKRKLWDFVCMSRNGHRHKLCEQMRMYGTNKFKIELLYVVQKDDDLEAKRKELCLRIKPTLNKKWY